MEVWAFVSRHKPTDKQINICEENDIFLHHIGDADAFRIDYDWITNAWYEDYEEIHELLNEDYDENDRSGFDGVFVVHPAAALNLITYTSVGVFRNTSRPDENGKPKFDTDGFKIFR